jgi:hypothetical protein
MSVLSYDQMSGIRLVEPVSWIKDEVVTKSQLDCAVQFSQEHTIIEAMSELVSQIEQLNNKVADLEERIGSVEYFAEGDQVG